MGTKAELMKSRAASKKALAAKIFKTCDKNKDGGITKAEALAAKCKAAIKKATGHVLTAASFAEVDANSDGKVTKAELMKSRAASKKALMGKLFKACDANKDGSLTKAEALSATCKAAVKKATGHELTAAHFAEVDANSDGKV